MLSYTLKDSSYKHKKYERINSEEWIEKFIDLRVLKGEEFAFQLLLRHNEEIYYNLSNNGELSFRGLNTRIRIEMEVPNELKKNFKINFEGYVKDDDDSYVADPILRDSGMLVEQGLSQALWVQGKVSQNCSLKEFHIIIRLYEQKGYGDEILLTEIANKVEVLDSVLKPIKEGEFFLDLWQHPSNIARMYKTRLWSKEHFEIIENYIKYLSEFGQRVVTLIASDYAWAGQGCYKVIENPSNLFEYNMVIIFKEENGEFSYDFSIIDTYINICFKHGIDREIDVFGLLCNWGAFEFGNPVDESYSPIRLNYYDKLDKSFKFINNKLDLEYYIKALFKYLKDKGVWDKVRIICDEPNSLEAFKKSVELIDKACCGENVQYKVAYHDDTFLNNYNGYIKDSSLSLGLVIKNESSINKIKTSGGICTFYVCCFPSKPNTFLSSPLIENRIMPWLAYYFNLDGFLRWNYTVWPENPYNEPSYKFPTWKAGDMYFVYPGSDLKPITSTRFENLKFGIQDYMIFKLVEEKGYKKEDIINNYLLKVLGEKSKMQILERNEVKMNHSLDTKLYKNIRDELINLL